MSQNDAILVTGGTGYIGSFTAVELLLAGYDVIIVDSLYNSSEEVVNRIELLANKRPAFFRVDITDEDSLDKAFKSHTNIAGVIHFAALKSVGESNDNALEYYRVNVGGTMSLLRVMEANNVKNIVFSSSATVYGDATLHPGMIPIPEICPLAPTNPYGRTKFCIEMLIDDHVKSKLEWSAALLRYFNPAGAHPSGLLGEDPLGVPYNLLPLLGQVAIGKRSKLMVYGNDYASHDGTAIRDYIHVIDLAKGHIAALNKLKSSDFSGCRAWNLGTGKGSTVFEIVRAFSRAVGRDLPYEIVGRRPGDVLDLTAVPTRANEELHWRAEKSLDEACADVWRWVSNNPKGMMQEPPETLVLAWTKG